ncbi:MAG: hypothetical protein M1826_004799 [Phylliscum demangeonii]|nr:MAG: hypothetical protein M1826_004799 [Phylliscum demangeonii]
MAALRHDLINEQAAIQWQYQFQQWRLNKLQCGEADPLPAGTPTGPVVTYDAFVEANRAHKELTEGLRDMAATFNAARRQFIMHIRTAIRGYRASYAARHSRRPVRANAVPVPLRVRGPTDSNVVPVPAPVEMYLERLRFLEEWNDRPECRFITGWPAPPELVPW